jgi:hypothetical protein
MDYSQQRFGRLTPRLMGILWQSEVASKSCYLIHGHASASEFFLFPKVSAQFFNFLEARNFFWLVEVLLPRVVGL